jgi:hypothetical protein
LSTAFAASVAVLASTLGASVLAGSAVAIAAVGASLFTSSVFADGSAFAASIFVQIIAVSHADAGGTCTYTSSDKKKGYKC